MDNSGSRGLLAVFSSSPIARSSASLQQTYFSSPGKNNFPYWISFLHRLLFLHMSELEQMLYFYDEHFHLVILMSHWADFIRREHFLTAHVCSCFLSAWGKFRWITSTAFLVSDFAFSSLYAGDLQLASSCLWIDCSQALHRLRVSSRFSFYLFYRAFMGSCHRSLGRFMEADIFDYRLAAVIVNSTTSRISHWRLNFIVFLHGLYSLHLWTFHAGKFVSALNS